MLASYFPSSTYNSNSALEYAESSSFNKRLIQGLVDVFGMAVGFISFIIVRYTLVSFYFFLATSFKYY
jgi:hypothetical protein